MGIPADSDPNSGIPATVSYTFIRSINVLIVRVHFGGKSRPGPEYITRDFAFFQRLDEDMTMKLAPVDDVRGTCAERP